MLFVATSVRRGAMGSSTDCLQPHEAQASRVVVSINVFSSAVDFFNPGPHGTLRQNDSVSPRRCRIELEPVRTGVQELFRCGERVRSLRYPGSLESLECHESQRSPARRRRRDALCKHSFPCGANPWARYLARLDAVAKPPCVLPHRPRIEHARKPILCEHDLELPTKLGRRDSCRITPFSLEEVHMAVPEPSRDGQTGTVDGLDAAGYSYRRPAARRRDLAVLDEDDTVA
jgi:hypothetical protein